MFSTLLDNPSFALILRYWIIFFAIMVIILSESNFKISLYYKNTFLSVKKYKSWFKLLSCSENLLNGKLKIHIPFYKKNFKHKKNTSIVHVDRPADYNSFCLRNWSMKLSFFGYDKLLEIYQFPIWMLLDDYTLDPWRWINEKSLVCFDVFLI